MGAHVIAHGRPEAPPKSAFAERQRAAAKGPLLMQRRVTFLRARVALWSVVVPTPSGPWLTETELKARRARNLLEDNPASG